VHNVEDVSSSCSPRYQLAPLDDYKVATFIHSRSRGNGHIALACFHQPYSASFVRIHVLYTDASVTDPEADVKVILGHAPHGGHQKIVRNVKKVDLKVLHVLQNLKKKCSYLSLLSFALQVLSADLLLLLMMSIWQNLALSLLETDS
jgi:hypothetical protein